VNYEESIEYVQSFVDHERAADWVYPEAFKLDRMHRLCKDLGNPQNAFESAIVAGSKGKGSVATILASILRMENYKVGLYTSPHLIDLRERIRVNGLCVSEVRFAEYVSMFRKLLDTSAWRKDPPTYFEVLTAMAFHHFREMKVHVAVLEVGLGGLYDSTNVAPAKVAGLAPISLEHTDRLGKTVAKIAVQKAGIIKGREIVVSAPQAPDAEAVIERAARDREAELLRVGREVKVFPRDYSDESQKFDVRTPYGNHFDLEIRLLGRHQIDNAAVAVAMAEALTKKTRLTVTAEAIRRGTLDAHWPGRLERVARDPDIVFDGAQNPDSAEKLVAALKRHFHWRRLLVVMGVSSDKDAAGILAQLLPETACLWATRSTNPRALAPGEIAREAEGFTGEVFVEPDFRVAFRAARASARPNDMVLVTGSLFLVGDVKAAFSKELEERW